MTSLPARPQYKGRRENTSFSSSSSLTVLFEACILVRVQFLSIMASTSKAFEIVCGSVSSLFDTRWHTHNLCVFLFGQGARTRCPWGENLRALVLCLFSRKEGQPSASRDSGPTAAEARRRMKLAVGSKYTQVHPAAACRSRRGCTWGGAARAAPPTMLLIG